MTLGWLGNVFILIAMWQIGCKNRTGWVWSIIGNFVWCFYAINLQMWDMLFMDGVAFLLAGYNWWKWRLHATT